MVERITSLFSECSQSTRSALCLLEGRVYQGSSKENINYEKWDTIITNSLLEFSSGDYPALVVTKGDGLAEDKKEILARILQRLNPTPVEPQKKVRVTQTPTGFLNARSSPSLNVGVVTRVNPG